MVAGFDVESPLVRLLRTLPLLRLIKGAARLNVVFGTFLSVLPPSPSFFKNWPQATLIRYSLPSIWNIAILLFVVYYAFAILGMNILGHLGNISKNGINDQVNFSSFGLAMLTLFRLSTLDSWPYLMFDSQKSPIGCELVRLTSKNLLDGPTTYRSLGFRRIRAAVIGIGFILLHLSWFKCIFYWIYC